ncbi:MAG: DUF302 domain-containing protein [Caulobacterales bacterium]
MSYYFAKHLDRPFDEVVERVRAGLQDAGFGVITQIDIQATLKAKLDADFRPYLILGACNPAMAHEALKLEDKVGAMLPCNVVVQASPGGGVEVAAIDPVASMQAIDNPALKTMAGIVAGKLKGVVEAL